jgi:pimeloyl-ACP methyl ester carboxylesterase
MRFAVALRTVVAMTDEQAAGLARDARERLLNGLPVVERRLELAGISTAVLEGGEGPPIVLLHGPGEFAAKWMRVIPALVAGHSVIAPDLPAHGETAIPVGAIDAAGVLAWLEELIARTCRERPALVGHVLGGAIAARFAITRGQALSRLVLVDSLGLARFRPAPGFALTLLALQAKPSERTYDRFMRHCSVDLDALREELGERWQPYESYLLEVARSPRAKAVRALMRRVGVPSLPPGDLARIAVPTSLIWGRQDQANRLAIAKAASERYGWPLRVIDRCADDPARDRPEAFLRALHVALGRTVTATLPRVGSEHVGTGERRAPRMQLPTVETSEQPRPGSAAGRSGEGIR